MKNKFLYVIRYKDMDLWLAHKGSHKWTGDRKNIHVFKTENEETAHNYVKNNVQQYHKEPLVMESW